MKKVIILLGFMLLLSTAILAQEPENYVLIEQPTNVRSYPPVPYAYVPGDMIGVANNEELSVTGRNFVVEQNCNGNWRDEELLWFQVDFHGIRGWVNYCINPFSGNLQSVPLIKDIPLVNETPGYFQDRDGYYFWRDGLRDRDTLGNPPDTAYLIAHKRYFRINLREMPNQTAEILDKMTADNVYVVGRNDAGTWLKIVYTGRTPYVANTEWQTVRQRTGWIATFTVGGLPENWQEIVPVVES